MRFHKEMSHPDPQYVLDDLRCDACERCPAAKLSSKERQVTVKCCIAIVGPKLSRSRPGLADEMLACVCGDGAPPGATQLKRLGVGCILEILRDYEQIMRHERSCQLQKAY